MSFLSTRRAPLPRLDIVLGEAAAVDTDDERIRLNLREALRAAVQAQIELRLLQAPDLLRPRTDDDPMPSVEQWQDASARVGVSLARLRDAMGEVNAGYGLRSAQQRLLRYFRQHLNQVISGDALSGVAAIQEWARRVRELRLEKGWPIESGLQRVGLRPDEYVLIQDEPDAELAARWRLASEIRRRRISGKDRLLAYLQSITPAAADQEELSYVARITSWQRRLRELDEEGWEIRSNVDEPELAPGTYRLATLTRRPPRARQAIALRYQILERDDFRCGDCGARPGEEGVRLEVHHKRMVKDSGDNEPANLITLCDACHAGRHAVLRGATDDELRRPEVEADY